MPFINSGLHHNGGLNHITWTAFIEWLDKPFYNSGLVILTTLCMSAGATHPLSIVGVTHTRVKVQWSGCPQLFF